MKKGKGFKKGVGTFDLEKLEKRSGGEVEGTPDVLGMYKSQYKGKTQLKKEDGRRNVPIIEDKQIDPYAKVRSTKKHPESGIEITTAFDKKAYQEMMEE